ncbi:predicted protein [Sclerotinia sclerotiorum 1980 UF-70]|uniref:Uncharacterized protein n=1 Tax=Sclerotinia sclerotiorum (strain ATCC 18683 / 1980 / Ss-1) TaxID=665079 RepID=A7E5K3_SCLS1|nr:predicted protein [Sclerotinia sclerotiorum 1980 UF-70]EDN91175.1 predicted protein [Sclerotinia sclerotiorum 1980 UF-70]
MPVPLYKRTEKADFEYDGKRSVWPEHTFLKILIDLTLPIAAFLFRKTMSIYLSPTYFLALLESRSGCY